jgi:hypothetical protein
VTRGEGNGCHKRWVVGGCAMCRGGRRKRTPVMRPGTKETQGHGDELCARNR